ncbi:hypothetical protein HID58_052005 [Brassica napus]|uniref:Uncharacterized protein n=1 Tax=Brassica napus TaxID=3708 RepID=A0ABQ8AAS2_BRANA|nr:hypothetical protein HID58_052005 [Brassica napus]
MLNLHYLPINWPMEHSRIPPPLVSLRPTVKSRIYILRSARQQIISNLLPKNVMFARYSRRHCNTTTSRWCLQHPCIVKEIIQNSHLGYKFISFFPGIALLGIELTRSFSKSGMNVIICSGGRAQWQKATQCLASQLRNGQDQS